ncbi:MAG TPA: signal peptidase I [Candidatus Bathyarchaeia archaeon]|nr:signal peptidase I [Candidatus Bathyarchaeia archaeon]
MSQNNVEDRKQKSKKKWLKRKAVKEFIEIIVFLGLAILLIFSFNWILKAALHTDTPLVIVTSRSMEPTYYGSNRHDNDIRKDMLIVKGIDPSKIKIGDCIVFYQINASTQENIIDDPNYVPIVHRVNRIYQDNETGEYWFTTKGDNPNTNDLYIDLPTVIELQIHQDRVIGIIIGRIPYFGGILFYFKTPQGLSILAISVAAILVLVFLFSNIKKKNEEIFEENNEKDSRKQINDSQGKSIKQKFKLFYKKAMKNKRIIIPSLILTIVVFIPIIDTLAADWDSEIGVINVVDDGALTYQVKDGNFMFIYADVTINNPGHWRFKLRSFTIELINSTSEEVLGSNNWTIVYNFEGLKTVTTGVWADLEDVTLGLDYTFRVTAFIETKFGNSFTSNFNHNFTLIIK